MEDHVYDSEFQVTKRSRIGEGDVYSHVVEKNIRANILVLDHPRSQRLSVRFDHALAFPNRNEKPGRRLVEGRWDRIDAISRKKDRSFLEPVREPSRTWFDGYDRSNQ